jgi:DNA modification methylase
MKPTITTEMMDLDALIKMAHPANPKEHDVPELIESFGRFKFVAPPAIDESTMTMVAGHGRCEALDEMRKQGMPPPPNIVASDGTWWVPVLRGISFANEKERDAYVIADNQHVIHGGWKLEVLAKNLDSLRDAGGFRGLGFDAIDIASFGFGSVESNTRENTGDAEKTKKPDPNIVDQDNIPSPPIAPVTKCGDEWKLGNSILLCADCTSLVPGRLKIGKTGFGFTSPPYNVGKNTLGGNKQMVASKYRESDDAMDSDAYADLLRLSTTLMLRACSVVAVNLQSLAGNKRVIARWVAKFADQLVDRAIWFKGQGAPAAARNVMNSRFEDVYIFGSSTRPSRSITTGDFHGTVSNVYEAARGGDKEYSDVHAATMPVHFAQWAIESFGSRADFVVDPFAGTGTTMIVAEKLGKRCASVEMDPSYCDVIVERWQNATGGKAERVTR